MLSTKPLLTVITSLLATAWCGTSSAATQAVGSLMVEGGRAYPQTELASWLTPGPAYRASIFGGAKVPVPFVGAVGLGLDFTYSQFDLKGDAAGGHYRKYLWDWFFLPINMGFLNITPGLAWVVTDVKNTALSVNRVSIRPAAVISAGLRVGLVPNVALTADVRAEKVIPDMEELRQGGRLNLTGSFVTGLAGVMAYF